VTRRKLLRLVDIAEILGVTKQRADQLRRLEDFPAPWTNGLGAMFGLWRTFGDGRGPMVAERRGGVPGRRRGDVRPRDDVRLRTPRDAV
jgi:hypothetical protein